MWKHTLIWNIYGPSKNCTLHSYVYLLSSSQAHLSFIYMFCCSFFNFFILGFTIVENQLPMHGLGMSFSFPLVMLNNTVNPLVVAWIVHLEAWKKMKALI